MLGKIKGLKSFLISFITVAMIVFFVLWLVFDRMMCAGYAKAEFKKFHDSLLESGYDISYSNLEFSKSYFKGVMTVSDLRINSLDPHNYWEWNVEELKLRPGLFNSSKISFSASENQTLKIGTTEYKLKLPSFTMIMGFNKDFGVNNINITADNIEVENEFKVKELKLASQRMALQKVNYMTPFFENHLELIDIEVLREISPALSKHISRIYLNANIVGALQSHDTYRETIVSWLNSGGMIDIKKFILNWDYFTLVGKGDIYFNENAEPAMHLNTSSKGMIAFIDAVQTGNYLDSKGIFVAKILLNNKAFLLNEDDKYYTITTPINLNKNDLSIENIVVKRF